MQPRPMTVLVADPDPTQRHQLALCLSARYRVVVAEQLAEAIACIARDHPQVLVLELNHPDGDGIQLIRRLRGDPATRGMIIVCMTTRKGVRDKVTGFQAGADDYLIKPVDLETFALRLALLARLRRLSS